MRVLLGLAVLAAGASAQVVVSGPNTASQATPNTVANTNYNAGVTKISVTSGAALGNNANPVAPAAYISFTQGQASSTGVATNGFNAPANPAYASTDRITVQTFSGGQAPGSAQYAYIQVDTNSITAQVQYQLVTGNGAITCDPCATNCVATGSASQNGPTDNSNLCANLVGRVYRIPLVTGLNQFKLFAYDYEGYATTQQISTQITYTFSITRPVVQIVGDPQIVGMQGQDFQVHGMPDEIFNMVTYPNVQVNARFTYLSEAECPDNYTTCFAHPGTYISEQGVRVGKDKVRVVAGPAKKGLTVHVNGKKVHQKVTHLKLGSVEIVNHRRVVVKTPIAALSMTNSDKFMNQEINMFDEKLLALGSTRHALKAGQAFHPEVPLHGLQGQTWRNVEYPSGLEYEGSIMDYHVVDGNLFGTDFVFNKFEL